MSRYEIILRTHEHAAGASRNAGPQEIGRSRGGPITKIHTALDGRGRPLSLRLSEEQRHGVRLANALLSDLRLYTTAIADRDHDVNAVVPRHRCRPAYGRPLALPPPQASALDAWMDARRNRIEGFFGRIEEFRRVAARYEKLARNYLSKALLAVLRILLRTRRIKSTAGAKPFGFSAPSRSLAAGHVGLRVHFCRARDGDGAAAQGQDGNKRLRFGRDRSRCDSSGRYTPWLGQSLCPDPNAPYKVDHSASPKLTEPLLDTPKTITAIPKEVIKESGSTSLKDVFRLLPGITLGSGEGGNAFGDRIFIRGYDARNDVYIDGLRDPGVVSRETFAIEQIEILQGPSATIGGRGTTGGAVKIINKTPAPEDFTEVETTIGANLTRRLTFDVNKVISPKVSLRVNGLVHDAKVAGRDEVYDKRYGGAGVMDIMPTDALKITLDYYHLSTDALPDWGFPYDVENNRPYDVERDNFYGLVDRDFHDTSANIGTGRVQYEFSDTLRLDAQTRYGVTTNAYVVSAPRIRNVDGNVYVSAGAARRDQENEYTGGQVNVIKEFTTGRLGHTIVGGMELSREDVENRPPVVDPRSVAQDLHNPDPHQPWTGTITPGTTLRKTSVDTRAFYLLDTVRINEQWIVSGGLRHDSYDIEALSGPTDYSEAA